MRFIIILLFVSASYSCKTSSSALKLSQCPQADSEKFTKALSYPHLVQGSACYQEYFQQLLAKEKDERKTSGSVDAYSPKKLKWNSSRLGSYAVTRGNWFDLDVRIQGADIFDSMVSMIENAKEEVLFQTFYWEESQATRKLLKAIKTLEATRRSCGDCKDPVVVKFVILRLPTALQIQARFFGDGVGPDPVDEIRKSLKGMNIDRRYVDFEVVPFDFHLLGSNHVKSIVVDGQLAMLTGANAQRFNDPDIDWYDLGFMVYGPMAMGVRYELINSIIRAHEGKEKDLDQGLAVKYGIPFQKKFASSGLKSLLRRPYLVEDSAMLTSRNGRGSPNNDNNNTQNRAFQGLFYAASDNIKIMTPNLNDDAAIRGLAGALKRGVKVNLLLSKRFNCTTESYPGQGGPNIVGLRRLYEEAGLEFSSSLVDARWFSREIDGQLQVVVDVAGAKKNEERPYNSHAKFMMVDDQVVAPGTANLDTQSWNHSRELNMIVWNQLLAQEWAGQTFTKHFDKAFAVTASELEAAAEKVDCSKG